MLQFLGMCCSHFSKTDPLLQGNFVPRITNVPAFLATTSWTFRIAMAPRKRDAFNTRLSHFIPHICQFMNKAVSFCSVFFFLYGIKLYFMKHVVKGGILAVVAICLYAFITVIASAL